MGSIYPAARADEDEVDASSKVRAQQQLAPTAGPSSDRADHSQQSIGKPKGWVSPVLLGRCTALILSYHSAGGGISTPLHSRKEAWAHMARIGKEFICETSAICSSRALATSSSAIFAILE